MSSEDSSSDEYVQSKKRTNKKQKQASQRQPTQSQQTQRGRANKRKAKEDDDDEEEGVQSQRAHTQINEDIKIGLVADVVRFILCKDSTKQIIRKTDIQSKVISNYKKHFTEIMEAAQRQIFDTFGMQMIEVENKKGQYIMVNTLFPSELEEFIEIKTDSQKTEFILLMNLLSFIELSNGKIEVERAIDGISKVKIGHLEHKDKAPTDKWWENLIPVLCKQLYIEKIKEKSPHGKDSEYFIAGFRSKTEIGRMNINKFIAKSFGEELDDIRAKEIEDELLEEQEEMEKEKTPRTQRSTQKTRNTQSSQATQRASQSIQSSPSQKRANSKRQKNS
jgi:hypothetical protein